MEVMCSGEPYTSSDGTWENVVMGEGSLCPKPLDEMYELVLYQIQNVEALKKMREERDALLAQSDKYVTIDYPHLHEIDKQNWSEYRRNLRNIPLSARPTLDADGNLIDIEWPVTPIEAKVKAEAEALAEALALAEAKVKTEAL